ncbi:hypothetical protein AB0H73_05990 [Streptomyces olivoreticuli]
MYSNRPAHDYTEDTDPAFHGTHDGPPQEQVHTFARYDENAAPPARPQHTNPAHHQARSGWDRFERIVGAGSSSFEEKNRLRLKISHEPTLLKMLQDAPFDSYHSHWVQEITSGRRSFTGPDKGCPLCDDLEYQARKVAVFNVGVYNEAIGTWEARVWEVGAKVAGQLKALHTDKRRGPLLNPALYLAVNKTGTGKDTEYHLETVKARDLGDDWGIPPISEFTHTGLLNSVQTEEWERPSSKMELKGIVERLLGESQPDDGYGRQAA